MRTEKNRNITTGFWKEKQDLIRKVTIPYIWKALNDDIAGIAKSGAVQNFEVAAGRKKGNFFGLVSQDSDLFKWIEAASYALTGTKDEELDTILDELAVLLGDAQQKDGYLNTYYILNGLQNSWSYLKESCQLYCAGHFLEAAVTHYEMTGKRNLLDIACRYADCIERNFGKEDGKIEGYDGHAEIELALYRLYECTGEERYRKLANYFVEERGQQPFFFDQEQTLGKIRENLVYELKEEDYSHSQSHLPIRNQKEARGHAVKAMYFYCAATDKARIEHDQELLQVLKELWVDVTERKMYVTGAIGAREYGESFSYAYDLPLDVMYGETCASIGLMQWAERMLKIEPNGKYADIIETAMYNGVLCGISEKGTEFFYTNVLEADPQKCEKRKEYAHIMKERQPWFECPCCPPNIARTILSWQKYLCSSNQEKLMIHQYMACEIEENGWKGIMKTEYPYDGQIELDVISEHSGEVKLRIPQWCEHYELFVDGIRQANNVQDGYLTIQIEGKKQYSIRLKLELKPEKWYANAQVSSLLEKAVVRCGPLIYCAEETDNPFLERILFQKDGKLEKEGIQILAEGVRCENQSEELYSRKGVHYIPCEIRMLPYYKWNNRGIGKMKTFFTEHV